MLIFCAQKFHKKQRFIKSQIDDNYEKEQFVLIIMKFKIEVVK